MALDQMPNLTVWAGCLNYVTPAKHFKYIFIYKQLSQIPFEERFYLHFL